MTMTTLMQCTVDDKGTATITLQRPEVHNAFNAQLINELTTTLSHLEGQSEVRILILTGAGDSFCAGGDLAWMRSTVNLDREENRQDALKLATMLRTLNFFPKPTVAKINGSAYGGGVGLIACCDIAVATEQATFGLTEARLGLAPATIAPYVISAIGTRQARRYFLTGERFDASTAQRIGLVHEVVTNQQLDELIEQIGKALCACGPIAQQASKSLVSAIAGRTPAEQEELDQQTALLIATLRTSPEGQKGLQAFLEKSRPKW